MEHSSELVVTEFIDLLKQRLSKREFVKLTLSKFAKPEATLTNIYVRRVTIKDVPQLSFTYRYKTELRCRT